MGFDAPVNKCSKFISALPSNKLPGQKSEKCLVCILGETMTSWIHSEFNWPLVNCWFFSGFPNKRMLFGYLDFCTHCHCHLPWEPKALSSEPPSVDGGQIVEKLTRLTLKIDSYIVNDREAHLWKSLTYCTKIGRPTSKSHQVAF